MRVVGGWGCDRVKLVWGMDRGGWGTEGWVRGGDDNSGGCPVAVAGVDYWGWWGDNDGDGEAGGRGGVEVREELRQSSGMRRGRWLRRGGRTR